LHSLALNKFVHNLLNFFLLRVFSMSDILARYKLVFTGIAAGVLVAIIATIAYTNETASAQMMGGSSGGMDHGMSMDMSGSMGSGGMSGDMSAMAHNVPGAVLDMCHESGEMPPHYCEPTYHASTSVPAVKVSTVDIMDEKTLMVNLREVYSMTEGVNQRLVVAGGNGHLAGATIVESGWQGTNTVHLGLMGTGSIFDHDGFHIHIFPYTGE